jgi:UDP-N-acetylglucosamine 2-epimerase
VPVVGIQHGILYPGYYSYRHEADEGDCPIPDRTAVFGDAARRFLIEEGRYPETSLEVTGSPKFDALIAAARRWDRDSLRRELGIAPDEKLLVVASRYRPIRETHASIGTAFGGLVAAVEASAGVRMIVKPHPAEPVAEYQADLAGARRSRLSLPGQELLGLLHAADALVTVESLSAVEALVLDRPVLILNAPTNLREMVERGVALAVDEGEDPAAAVEALLFDEPTRRRLDEARSRYLEDVARGVDGGATRRIVSLLRRTAEERRVRVG